MDPDANLREQREIAADILRIQDSCTDDGCFNESQELALVAHAQRLAELVQALDGWLRNEGFQPAAWCYPFTDRTRPRPGSEPRRVSDVARRTARKVQP